MKTKADSPWSSRLPTFTNSRPGKKTQREEFREFLVSNPMTIRWTGSAQKFRSVKISTLCSQVAQAIRVASFRLSTTSWSRRNNSTTRWWLRIRRIASKCWTKEEQAASQTSCSRTITTQLRLNTVNSMGKILRLTQLLRTTSMSTAFRVTPSTRLPTCRSSRIEPPFPW